MTRDEARRIARGNLRQGFFSVYANGIGADLSERHIVGRYVGIDEPFADIREFPSNADAMEFCITQNLGI